MSQEIKQIAKRLYELSRHESLPKSIILLKASLELDHDQDTSDRLEVLRSEYEKSVSDDLLG